MPRFAARTDRIAASATIALNNLVKKLQGEGKDIVSFTVGEPDFDTPQNVKDAAIKALQAGKTKYVQGPGIPELRKAVADHHAKHNRIPCGPEHVMVTPAKHGIFLALQATVQEGDEVLLPDPAWVSYEPMVQWCGAKAVPVPLNTADNFRMTPDAVAAKITSKTRAIILNSPSNPTGGVNTPSDVRGIVELADKHDLWIISDEIYQHIRYDGAEHLSPASLPGAFERTITVDGVSKTYAMTGWRLGWIVAPSPAWAVLDRLQSQSLTHCTSFAMYGAVEALNGPQESVLAMKREFDARRKLMVEGLRKLPGVTCAMPGGAFYAFPRFSGKAWGDDDNQLAADLLEKAGVATTPGSSFGAMGRGHLRLSYATSQERIREGLRRLHEFALGR